MDTEYRVIFWMAGLPHTREVKGGFDTIGDALREARLAKARGHTRIVVQKLTVEPIVDWAPGVKL